MAKIKKRNWAGLLGGMGVGALFMWLFDPDRGRSRRARTGDKLKKYAVAGGKRVERTGRDLSNRAVGTVRETKKRMGEESVSDEQLTQRVRAELGHHTEAASHVEVTSLRGRVILSGNLPSDDIDPVVSAVRKVPGVEDVESRLTPGVPPTSTENGGEEARPN